MDTRRHLLPSRIPHGAEAALWTWEDSFLGGAGTGAPGLGGSTRLLPRRARGRGLGAARRHKGAASRLASRPLGRPTAGAQSKSAKEAGEGVLRFRKGVVTEFSRCRCLPVPELGGQHHGQRPRTDPGALGRGWLLAGLAAF